MSFAPNEEPHRELAWSDFEIFAMEEELDTLKDTQANNFITLQSGDGKKTPFETFLGGVRQTTKAGQVDVWVTSLVSNNSETISVMTGTQKFQINGGRVVVAHDPFRAVTRADVERVRSLIGGGRTTWSALHSLRIAEKLHETDKQRPGYKLLNRFFKLDP
jgi:hypothetical protein